MWTCEFSLHMLKISFTTEIIIIIIIIIIIHKHIHNR